MRFENRRLRDWPGTFEPITLVMADGSRHQLAVGQWAEIEQDDRGGFLRIVERGELPPDDDDDDEHATTIAGEDDAP